jgi:hypothetical protein
MENDESLPLVGTVLLRESSQYGAVSYQPANKLAEELCGIARTKNMTQGTIAAAKRMGLSVITTGEKPRSL